MTVTRYYLVTMHQDDETIRLGTTTAQEALRKIRSMRRDGWRTSLIERGTEHIAETDLDRDAAREVLRPDAP